MELKQFIELFAEQFDDTEPDLFTPATVFRDLEEWDSLTSLSVIAMIDEEMDISVSEKKINSCNTIGDLYNMVNG